MTDQARDKIKWPMSRLWSQVAKKLQVPAVEILVHFFVTVLTVVSIALIDWLVRVAGLDNRNIPGFNVKLSDWMFVLEVIAATGIISVGVIKAVVAAWKAP